MARQNVPSVYCWEIGFNDLWIYLASTDRGALRLGVSMKKAGAPSDPFHKVFPGRRLVVDKHRNRHLIDAVMSALENRPVPGELSLDISGTPFQLQAWRTISKIPFGETRTYGEVSGMMGKPGGARAVGQAMGANPLPLIFP